MTVQRKRDKALIDKLFAREGIPTVAVFKDGSEEVIYKIGWGYDTSDEFAHIFADISPENESGDFIFFFTNELSALLDPETRAPLFSFPI